MHCKINYVKIAQELFVDIIFCLVCGLMCCISKRVKIIIADGMVKWCNIHAGGRIGTIETLQHDVSGTLYFIDSRTIFIDNFNYDGQGPGN